ncbi:MAG TPA: hypothetical protein VGK63_02450 [Candidatus Limnocylindrales bacterium]
MTRIRFDFEPIEAALARFDLWAAALAGFLVRGGVILFVLPIVWLPSPLDLADVFSSVVTSAALGGPNPDLVRLVVVSTIATTVVVVVAFWLGALMDVLVAHVTAGPLSGVLAAPTMGGHAPSPGLAEAGRAFAARLVAFLPLGLALAVSAPIVVGAVYEELVNPSSLALPIVFRVLGDVPVVVAVIVGLWLVGDAIGGLAVRLIVADRRGAASALASAVGMVVRRPIAAVGTLAAGTAVVFVLVAPALLASAAVWRGVLFASRGEAGPILTGLGIVALAALWLGGLVLAAFATAVRAMLWSRFAARR